MWKPIFLVFIALSVHATNINAASTRMRSKTKAAERPEPPLLYECEDQRDCFIYDPANVDNWRAFLEEVQVWEQMNLKAAKEFYISHPKLKKEEQQKLKELGKAAAYHEYI